MWKTREVEQTLCVEILLWNVTGVHGCEWKTVQGINSLTMLCHPTDTLLVFVGHACFQGNLNSALCCK